MRKPSVIVVSGTPYQQGVQQGQALRETILKNIENIRADLANNHCDMDEYAVFMQKNVNFLQQAHPELMEEIAGIADGSGLPYTDILMINIPAYFMQRYFVQECSMILARGKATADGCTYLIKNRDMKMTVHQAVIEHHYQDGRVVSEVNGAGIVTYPANGMNNRGLAIATTGFWSQYTHVELEDIGRSHIFVNIHLLLMNCNTVAEVLQYLKNSPRMNGLNIIAADAEDAVVIETTRDGMTVRHDDGSGLLYRTNHYMLDENIGLNPKFAEYPSTFMRYARIEEMLTERSGKLRFQDLFRIMLDHENEPVNAICRHPNALVPPETDSSSLVVLEDGEMWTTLGNPCEHLTLSKIGEATL